MKEQKEGERTPLDEDHWGKKKQNRRSRWEEKIPPTGG